MSPYKVGSSALIAAILTMLGAGAAHAAVDARSQTVIRQSTRAMGLRALSSVAVMRVDAKVSAASLTGTTTQWLGISSSRFAEYTNLPPLKQDDGYDGAVFWNRDGSGLVWDDGSDAGRSAEISTAYISTFALWRPNAPGADVRYVGPRTDKGAQYDVLRVLAPGSKLPLDVWFGRSSHLLVRDVQISGPQTTTTTFTGYRRAREMMLPYHIHTDSTSGNTSDATITAIAFNPSGSAAQLTRPASSVHDFSMRNEAQSTTVPFDLVDNHVYLNVMLNGKGPYRMIFDTGGANVIDPAVAQEIGALGKGSVQGGGVGAKTESLSFANVDALQVGDATLRNQLFAVAPVRMGFGISGSEPADGLIGWEVLARYVTRFDYSSSRVVLTMPGFAQTPPSAHVVPLVFAGTQPQIPCGIDGITSECTIDTGARDTLTLYAPYIAQHPQVQPAMLTANGITGFGVGGPAFGRLGRLQSISIDGLTLNNLVAGYATATRGAFASPFLAANLGGNLLRRFDVTFDYGKHTMALVPNDRFTQPDTYERSGMFLVNLGGKKTVAGVRPGTPAADAGVVQGDVITSVDGTPTASMSLGTVRAYFLKPAGTVTHLVLTSKNGATRSVQLTLRDYV